MHKGREDVMSKTIIVGAGPAGLFAAIRLIEKGADGKNITIRV